MTTLGLGYEVARELNPTIIMPRPALAVRPGLAAGRLRHAAAAVSGFYEITGWDDRAPAGPFNAYTDTIAPAS
jgi:crotonobetainyl-CoA:carnitine CoA-transferase CaiB-like acyl-CoA transferase